jgi:exopolyphosphatase/guanosine-5'-triphosphate,3'-diphosphate pyrophosphatase
MKHHNTLTAQQPLAAIDVGSNTIHLVVALPPTSEHPDLTILVDELEFVRLGAGVGKTGRIAPDRVEQGLKTLQYLRELAEQAHAQTILCAATEVMRQAQNGAEFLERAHEEIGLEIPVISGEQEAAFTFWGATSGRQITTNQPVAVGDLGGGSLELVFGTGHQSTWRQSLLLGSGALHDRFIQGDPPTASEIETLRAEVRGVLNAQTLPEPAQQTPLLIVCGGTATTLLYFARRALGLSDKQNHLTLKEVEQAITALCTLSAEEVTKRYSIETPRARILGAGAAVLTALMERLAAPAMEISQRGIREGMLLAYARHGNHWLDVAEAGAL